MDAIYHDGGNMRECTSGEMGRLKAYIRLNLYNILFAYDAIALVRDAASTDTLIDSTQLNSWIQKARKIFCCYKRIM